MKRRHFITLLGGAAAAWPVVARGQQPSVPTIGYLDAGSRGSGEFGVAAFQQGLRDSGYIEGQNVAIQFRWADGQYDRMSAIAEEFVKARVAVIVTFAGTPGAQITKTVAATTPIVFRIGTDPVSSGLVASFNRPGGNATGLTTLTVGLAAKRLEILNDLVPEVRRVAFLLNRGSSAADPFAREMEAAATLLGKQAHAIDAQADTDLHPAFERMVEWNAGALVVSADQFLFSRRHQIAELAIRYKMPAIYYAGEYVKSGGLISYGSNDFDDYRQLAVVAARILKGSNPADLPVLQPTKFQLFINLKTAKALGLTVPPTLIARADEVIE